MTNGIRSQVALAATVLVGIGMFLFGTTVVGGDTFASADHVFSTLPALDALGEGLRAGELREWWGGVGLGVPLAANPDHAGLYPLTWLGALLGPRGIDALVALHLVAAGAGAAVLSRRLGAGPLGAATAGGAMLGAQIVSSSAAFAPLAMALAWTPWVVWAAHRVGTDASITRALALAALIGGQLSTGQFSVAAASFAAALAVAWSRPRGKALMWIVASGAGGALLSLHVILSAVYVELAGTPPLGDGWSARQLAGTLWPGAWYLGLPMVCVAVAVAVDGAGWTKRRVDASRKRRRDACVAAVCGAGLIAAGMWWGASAALVGAALLASAAGAGVERMATRGASRGQLVAMITVAFAAVIGAHVAGVPGADVASAGVATCVVVGCAGACARKKWRAWAGPLLCAVLVGHAVSHARSAPRVERSAVLARPAAIGDLRSEPPAHRIARPRLPGDSEGDPSPQTLARDAATLVPNTATRHSMAYVPGRGRAVSERLRKVWLAAAPHAERFLDLYGIGYIVIPASVAIPSGMPVAGTTPDGKLAVAKNLKLRPRAFVAPKWRWYASETELVESVFPASRDSARPIGLSTVRLLGSGPVSNASGPMFARPCELDVGFDRVVFDCDARSAGFAVLLDAHAPGWSATVDGKAARIERADVLARAVWINAGTRRVEMQYRTPGLRLGAAVAALAWLNLLVGWLIAVRKQGRADAAG